MWLFYFIEFQIFLCYYIEYVRTRGKCMDIKLIATDLDGTLLGADHMTVSDRTKEVFYKAHEKGVKIAISTGRTLVITDNVTKQMPFVDYVIYSNGAGVYDRVNKTVACSAFIDIATAQDIITFTQSRPLFYDVYKDGRQHTESDRDKYYNDSSLPIEFLLSYMETTVLHDDMLEFIKSGGIEKINIFAAKRYINEFTTFLNKFKNLYCTCPFEDSIEITNILAKKGNALKELCDKQDIKPSEVMVFGDSNNDVSMLEYTENSFAMANASDDCKNIARHETLSNIDDGVANAVSKYVLNI